MSLQIKGENCSRCHALLFDDDDVVYCPICGAPHHRDCYEALGHCALEELHGTDRQYSREIKEETKKETVNEQSFKNETDSQETVCKMCSATYDAHYPRCPECGAPNFSGINRFENFDLLGGVPADFKLSENVTADNAKRFVVNNTHRYIPKFATLSENNKTSWNWMAFFFPCGWMLSRKMYKNGIIAGLLTIIATLFAYPLSSAVYSLGITAENYGELAVSLMENMENLGIGVIIFAFLHLFFDLIIRVVCGLYGDYLYKKYTVQSIEKINNESEDADYDYRKKGGVSLFLFFIGIFAVQYIPNILIMFI